MDKKRAKIWKIDSTLIDGLLAPAMPIICGAATKRLIPGTNETILRRPSLAVGISWRDSESIVVTVDDTIDITTVRCSRTDFLNWLSAVLRMVMNLNWKAVDAPKIPAICLRSQQIEDPGKGEGTPWEIVAFLSDRHHKCIKLILDCPGVEAISVCDVPLRKQEDIDTFVAWVNEVRMRLM